MMEQLLQFWGPATGIVALAFWTGVLSSRVASHGRTLKLIEEHGKMARQQERAEVREFTELATLMKVNTAEIGKLSRQVGVLERQMANLVAAARGYRTETSDDR